MFLYPQPTTSCYYPRQRPMSMDWGYSPFSSLNPSYSDPFRAEREYQERLRREQAIRERAEYLRRAREIEELQKREEALRARQYQEELMRRRALHQGPLFGSPMFSPFFGRRPQYFDEDEEEEEGALHQRSASRSPSPQNSDDASERIRVPIRGQSRETSPAPSPAPPVAGVAPMQTQEPVTTSSTLTISDEGAQNAATLIQEHWRSFKARQASLSAISRYTSEFVDRKSSFVFPSQLEFSPTASRPILLYTSNNAPFHAYENDLTKLLTRIDAVESAGSNKVREARKALILAIEAELESLDKKKLDAWEDKVRAEKADEVAQVEMDLDVQPLDNPEEQSAATFEPAQVPLPGSPVLEPATLETDSETMARDVPESEEMDVAVQPQDPSTLESTADPEEAVAL